MTTTQKRAFLWSAGITVLLALMIAYNPTDGGEPSSSYDPAPYTAPAEITAEMVADAMGPSYEVRFCNAYLTIGDPAVAYGAFAQNYTHAEPSSVEVFDELVSRC